MTLSIKNGIPGAYSEPCHIYENSQIFRSLTYYTGPRLTQVPLTQALIGIIFQMFTIKPSYTNI